MRKAAYAALAWLALAGAAYGQAQLGAGQVLGNSTAAQRPARAESVTAIFDRALTSTRGSILRRGAAGWEGVAPSATVGLPWVSAGTGADPLYQLLTVAGGGTGINTLVIGDLLQASSTTALARLAAVATGNVLLSGGVGTVSAWGKVTSSHLNITTTSCTNQFLTAISATGTGTCTTDTLASAQHANQGTTTQVLHGNAAGNPSWGSVAYADIATADIATSAQYAAGTASKLVQSGTIYPTETTTTFGTTTTFDFSTFINTAVTLTGNITTQTLTNVTAGKAGTIAFIQDGGGSRTTVWSTTFKFAGGALPMLTTTANAIDILTYSCRSATFCTASLIKDVRNP
jgi:hypothetical protein